MPATCKEAGLDFRTLRRGYDIRKNNTPESKEVCIKYNEKMKQFPIGCGMGEVREGFLREE